MEIANMFKNCCHSKWEKQEKVENDILKNL